MRVLVEEYQYDAGLVRDVLHGIDALQNVEGKVSLSYVGYFYNTELKDCVFILPKVLMDESGKVFSKYSPGEIIHMEKSRMEDAERRFLYEFAVWIYRAVEVYHRQHPESDIVYHRKISQVGRGMKRRTNTLLDILLSLIAFNKDNRSYITFVLKNIHSGYNKINWTRTINHSPAIIQDDEPVYIKPVNKKRQVNFDEELLIIFYSILNHISETYGFHVDIHVGFELIKGARFESYLNGRGVMRLRQIKYKYFSDKMLELWNLCYAFFAHRTEITASTELKEYLLVKNFNIVFEAIIDELIGTEREKLPPRLADQSDGKVVDHLWVDEILLPTKQKTTVYYIGDSKYYKRSTPVGENSIYKQFTYARNVIQWSFDALRGKAECDDPQYLIRLRDERTEGYNVIPNFFISASVDFEKLDYGDDALHLHNEQDLHETSQFSDRLFDRDTLLLSHYDVNFLFVLSLYARNNSGVKESWKKKVRKCFRERVQQILENKYEFYALKGYDANDSERYITTHFQALLGKLYLTPNAKNIYTLAIERKEGVEGDGGLVAELRKHFYVAPCKLDDDPQERINEKEQAMGQVPVGKCVVVDDNSCDSTAEEIKRTGRYAIGLGDTSGSLALAEGFMNVQYLVLHKLKTPIVFSLKAGPRLVSKEQLEDTPHKMKESDFYIMFQVEKEEPAVAEKISQYALTHPPYGYTVRQSYVADINAMFHFHETTCT